MDKLNEEAKIWYLNDRGIRQAIDAGIIRLSPGLMQEQLQPASLDLYLDHIDEAYPLESMANTEAKLNGWRPENNLLLPPHAEATLKTTQTMHWEYPLRFKTELRSSLRRLSCYTRPYTMMLGSQLCVEMFNPGPIEIQFTPQDKIAQLLFFYSKDVETFMHEAGLSGFSKRKLVYDQLRSFDSGWAVNSREEAEKLVRDGHLGISPAPMFEGHLLTMHAGPTARVLREDLSVNFSAKEDISKAFEEVTLPYHLTPGEHIVVDAYEQLNLSPHVGIHFYDRLDGTSRGLSFLRSPADQIIADLCLTRIPDGWVDPGYQGIFSRQPKTYFGNGVVIHEGDVLGHGQIIFYPNGCERAYGSAGLGSHYQNQKETKLSQ